MTLLHLVGHDGSDHGDDALALARTIGAGRDVRRRVVHVLTAPAATEAATASVIDDRGASTRACVEQIRRSVAADEAFEVVIARSPAQGLHDRAEHHRADLIAIGARHHRFSQLHLPPSTVAGRLLSGGPCAVALAPDGYACAASTPARITVAFDGSESARDALAEAVVLAAQGGATLDLVCAYEPGGDPGAAERLAGGTVAAALVSLPPAVRGVGEPRAGRAGAAIDAFAAAYDADLIVLGSRGRGPLRRALLGSTGRDVLHGATRPILVVPRGTHVTLPTAGRVAVAP